MEWLESENEHWQPWAYGCLANIVLYILAVVVDQVDVVGFTAAISIGLALTAYVQWEWQRPRTAGLCLIGTVPLWLLLLSA